MSNLKRIREERNISQAKLAEETGISLRSIQAYEQNRRDINKVQGGTLLTLANVLDCKIEDLLETT